MLANCFTRASLKSLLEEFVFVHGHSAKVALEDLS